MLTHNDVTVDNADLYFNDCVDIPVDFWGFKNVGIDQGAASNLVRSFRDNGKTSFLEVVTYAEESCLESARMAVDCGFDYFTGSRYFPSVAEYLADQPIKYFPFVGDVGGSPVVLNGSIEEIVADTQRLEQAGAHGVDLVAYRHADADPVELAKRVVATARKEVILAGSIASEERIRIVRDINPFAFTMGGALFEKRFVPDGDFRANLERVVAVMDTL